MPHRRCGDTWSSTKWVVPFGNSGVKGYLHLTRTYRSLSRPSSPPRAKASTGRPSFTFLLFELYVQLLLYSTCYSCEIVYYILIFVEIYFVYKLSMNVHLSMRCESYGLEPFAKPDVCYLLLFRCVCVSLKVVPGRVELPTSTLSV